jgi:caffeoyl-CoA O-methyltransferase
MNARTCILVPLLCSVAALFLTPCSLAQEVTQPVDLDATVEAFLERHEGQWHDMNVPASDGKLLFNLIVKNKYRRALEIGTSTGYSGIWMAWALSRTGGKLITIEIDEDRYRSALANFREAGLSKCVDARLADAHELVEELQGPFDFAFCDADKGWYKNYFVAVDPKLEVGGCYTAHNVSARGRGSGGLREFVEYVSGLENYETTFDESGGGISISVKKSKN